MVLDLAIPLGEKPGNSATFGFDCPDEGQAATICQPRRRSWVCGRGRRSGARRHEHHRGRRPDPERGERRGEKMWPGFGARVGRWGVHSALSLPLLLPDQVVGAINLYAYGRDVFDGYAAELGELFAKPAAVAVHNAQILAGALARTIQLQSALSTRTVIDQAIGLIRGRTGRSAEDAFAQLRAMSQAEDRKLADVAQHIVDDAVRCARARHSPT